MTTIRLATDDKPPTDSRVQAAVWWLTRPWTHTIALMTPIVLVIGVLMLFAYLTRIHRGDLLLQTVGTSSGLILMVVAALLFSLAWIIAILGSALLFCAMTVIYPARKAVPKGMPDALLIWSITWGILLVASIWQSSEQLGMAIPGLLIGVVTFSVMLHLIDDMPLGHVGRHLRHYFHRVTHYKHLRPRSRKALRARGCRSFQAVCTGVAVGFATWFALLAAALAPLCILTIAPSFATRKIDLATTLIWVGTSVPGPLIGWVFFRDFVRGTGAAIVRMKIAVVCAIAAICVLASSVPLDMQLLRTLGVYSTAPTRFAISDKNLTPSLETAGFKVQAAPEGADVFTAYVRFRFGGLLVLCTEPYDPLLPLPGKQATVDKKKKPNTLPGRCLDMHPDAAHLLAIGQTKPDN